jgi:hypothetical protein
MPNRVKAMGAAIAITAKTTEVMNIEIPGTARVLGASVLKWTSEV